MMTMGCHFHGGKRAVVSTLAGGVVSGTSGVYVDGAGTNAGFNGPCGAAVDASGNVFVTDFYNQRIRKVTAAGGMWALSSHSQLALRTFMSGAAGANWPLVCA
jgi:hypothetical protein